MKTAAMQKPKKTLKNKDIFRVTLYVSPQIKALPNDMMAIIFVRNLRC